MTQAHTTPESPGPAIGQALQIDIKSFDRTTGKLTGHTRIYPDGSQKEII